MDTNAVSAVNTTMPCADVDLVSAANRARRVLDGISDKWTVQVISALTNGTQRFGQLRKQIMGISQKMLTETLRKLEEHKLVTRKVYATVPPMVEYTLTPLGFSMVELLQVIGQWSESYMQALEAMKNTEA